MGNTNNSQVDGDIDTAIQAEYDQRCVEIAERSFLSRAGFSHAEDWRELAYRLADPSAKPWQSHIYAVAANYCGKDAKGVFSASMQKLEEQTGRDRRVCSDVLNHAVELGLMIKVKRTTFTHVSSYQLNDTHPAVIAAKKWRDGKIGRNAEPIDGNAPVRVQSMVIADLFEQIAHAPDADIPGLMAQAQQMMAAMQADGQPAQIVPAPVQPAPQVTPTPPPQPEPPVQQVPAAVTVPHTVQAEPPKTPHEQPDPEGWGDVLGVLVNHNNLRAGKAEYAQLLGEGYATEQIVAAVEIAQRGKKPEYCPQFAKLCTGEAGGAGSTSIKTIMDTAAAKAGGGGGTKYPPTIKCPSCGHDAHQDAMEKSYYWCDTPGCKFNGQNIHVPKTKTFIHVS